MSIETIIKPTSAEHPIMDEDIVRYSSEKKRV